MNTFKWLLKREFWEHKGGFFWTPVVVGALMTTFIAVSLVIAVLGLSNGMQINGVGVQKIPVKEKYIIRFLKTETRHILTATVYC